VNNGTADRMVYIHVSTRFLNKITDVCDEQQNVNWELASETGCNSDAEIGE